MKLWGLEVIVSEAVEKGTMHGIKSPPPERREGEPDEAFQARYDEWWRTACLWTVRGI